MSFNRNNRKICAWKPKNLKKFSFMTPSSESSMSSMSQLDFRFNRVPSVINYKFNNHRLVETYFKFKKVRSKKHLEKPTHREFSDFP